MLENTHIKIVRGNDPTTFNLTIQELIDGDYEDLHDIILGAEIKLFTPSDKYYVVSNEHILVDGNILSFSILTSSMEYAKYSIDITLITSTDQRHSHISNCFELVSEDSEFQSADYVIGNEANLTIYIAPDVDYITFGKTELQNYYTKDVINQKLSELSEATMNAISNIDLSPFATKTELSDAVNNAINSINLTPYATKEWVA